MRTKIEGIYRDGQAASRAVSALLDESFESGDIRVVVEGAGGGRVVPVKYASPWGRGAAIGAVAGAALGVAGAWLIELGVMADPGIGLYTGGVWVATLKGAFVLGALGALTGFVTALAIWTAAPQLRVEPGDAERVRVGVEVRSRRVEAVRKTLERAGAIEIEIHAPGDPRYPQAA